MRGRSLPCGPHCFGDTPTDIQLDPVTAFIGLNGSGKTAAFSAFAGFSVIQQAVAVFFEVTSTSLLENSWMILSP